MESPLRAGIAAALLSLAGGASAQDALAPVTVTANPLGSAQSPGSVTTLSGASLLLRSQPTLGETLSGVPGVAGTYFGPGASRPIVRGLDGDRIRVLENSSGLRDVSSLSYDHAVSLDPLAVERIEVLRGAGALLYGGNALGGVVNLIDNRIPRAPLQGITGRADVGLASGSRERHGAVLLEAGNGRAALHVDASRRSADDTRVPLALPCTQGGVTVLARRLCNSQSDASGGAIGGSVFVDGGYAGLSASGFGTDYGSVAEDEVTLAMRSRRLAAEGQVRLRGPLESLKVQAAHTDYRHTEFDAGAPGTVFRNRGNELRVEARHAPIGPLQGVAGLQLDGARLRAEGAEAFLPPSRTREQALFVHEELPTGWGKLTFGLRHERVRVESLGDPLLPRFAPARREFSPTSWAAGAVWNLAPRWELTASAGRTQRAPRDYELFADVPHVATAAYEVGNPGLGAERAASFEAAVQWKDGAHRRFRAGVFQQRFPNYIALLATGLQRDAQGNGAAAGATDCGDGTSVESGCAEELLPEVAYQPVAARFRGFEAEGGVRLLEGAHAIDLELRADLVRADNVTRGEPLPRIPPARLGATVAWSTGPWQARLGFDSWARQSRVPAGEAPVAGFTVWNAALTRKVKAGPAELLAYVRVDNLGNRLAYSSTSILTQLAPGRVPLPGRSVRVGLRADF